MNNYLKELENLLHKPESYYFDKIIAKYGFFDLAKNESVILFGAGVLVKSCINACTENAITILGIADNNLSLCGSYISGISVIGIERLLTFPLNTPIIVTTLHDYVVISQLRDLGFTRVWSYMHIISFYPEQFANPHWSYKMKHILNHPGQLVESYMLYGDEYSQKTFVGVVEQCLTLDSSCIKNLYRPIEIQYFDPEFVRLSDHECFVDGGAFTGDTLSNFLQIIGDKYDAVYCFEPDQKSFKELEKYALRLNTNKTTLYPYALGEKKDVLMFKDNRGLGSFLSEDGALKVEVVSLDNVLENKKVTFVKLDVEGAELSALKGA